MNLIDAYRLPKKPLVSVVTPTWQRTSTLLQRLLPSMLDQTYSEIEHVIVSDGPDSHLAGTLERQFPDEHYKMKRKYLPAYVPYRLFELGQNSSSLARASFGVAPNLIGSWLARGKYIVCIADDDLMEPTFLAECVAYLEEEPEIGFIYTGFRHRTAERVYDVNGIPPRAGCVCSPVFRASLLGISGWQMHEGMQSDWKMVERWIDAGVQWGHIDTILLEHFADH